MNVGPLQVTTKFPLDTHKKASINHRVFSGLVVKQNRMSTVYGYMDHLVSVMET